MVVQSGGESRDVMWVGRAEPKVSVGLLSLWGFLRSIYFLAFFLLWEATHIHWLMALPPSSEASMLLHLVPFFCSHVSLWFQLGKVLYLKNL